MGSRLGPVSQYNLNAANSFIGNSLHDLNTVDARTGEIDGISDVDRDAVTGDSLDNDDDSNSAQYLTGKIMIGSGHLNVYLNGTGFIHSSSSNDRAEGDVKMLNTTFSINTSEWFKRLTGRHEAVVTERDYKFYSARHKYRRTPQSSISSVPGLPAFPNSENSTSIGTPPGLRPPYVNDVLNLTARSPPQMQHQPQHQLQCLPHQPQHQSLHQSQHQSLHQSQQTSHLSHPTHAQHCTHTPHLDDMSHAQHASAAPQHLSRNMQPPPGLHVGGRMLVLPAAPAKYCDQCGSPYVRESSKFCSECGAKRIGT